MLICLLEQVCWSVGFKGDMLIETKWISSRNTSVCLFVFISLCLSWRVHAELDPTDKDSCSRRLNSQSQFDLLSPHAPMLTAEDKDKLRRHLEVSWAKSRNISAVPSTDFLSSVYRYLDDFSSQHPVPSDFLMMSLELVYGDADGSLSGQGPR